MAEIADESWWIKIGAMYDGSGFKAAIGGIFDLRRAAEGLYESFRKVIDANSDLYLTARYLNVPTDALQTWERAFRLMGGSADEARGAIASLNFVYDRLRLGMDSGAAEIAARLHLTPDDLLSFENILRGLNRVYNELWQGDYGGFKVLADQLGLSETAILMVTQNTRDFNRLLKESNAIPLIPEHQLRASRELTKQFEMLKIAWESFKSSLISTAAPSLSELMDRLTEVLLDPETINNARELFANLERGINQLASNENLDKLQEFFGGMLDLVKASGTVAGWIGGGARWAGGAVGSVVGFLTKDQELAELQRRNLARQNPDISMGTSLVSALNPLPRIWSVANPGNLVQYINIDGRDKSPAEIGQAVVEAGKTGYDYERSIQTTSDTTLR